MTTEDYFDYPNLFEMIDVDKEQFQNPLSPLRDDIHVEVQVPWLSP